MGHTISTEGIQPAKDKVKAIQSIPRPENAEAARRYNGMITYLSRFSPHLSQVVRPIRQYIQTGEWGPKQEEAFITSKQLIQSAPTLAYFDNTCITCKHYISTCITCKHYISTCITCKHYINTCITCKHYIST